MTQAEQTVLLPDQLYKELQEATATAAEKLARHQDERSAIGKKLGYDVGPPNERVIMANGQEMEARDDLGLIGDTRLYSKKSCTSCYGRGILTTSVPIRPAQALKLIADNPANEALLHQSEPGKYSARNSGWCGCARRRYLKLHAALGMAFVKAGIAKHTGMKVENDGYRKETFELM